MSARAGRRRGRGHGAEHEDEERWLLTYADMITLLMALFMVLFSISAVNKSKLQVLQQSLQQAFAAHILPGGISIQDNGGGPQTHQSAPVPPIPAIQPFVAQQSSSNQQAAQQSAAQQAAAQEQQSFERLKRQIDHWVQTHGLANQVQTVIDQRGLVVRLLTDNVLFDSGQAQLKPQSNQLLSQVAELLQTETHNPIQVGGHTDDVPISGSVYPTNWELSTARASRVVRFLIDAGVDQQRLSAAGYASLHPVSSNATADGRAHNRRVEIVLLRSGQGSAGGGN